MEVIRRSYNRSILAASLLLVMAAAGAYLLTVDDELGDWAGDAAHYVLLARSLAAGDGYADPVFPGHIPHTKYPPLFPLIMAPVIYLAGTDMSALRAEVAIMAALSVLFWMLYFRRRTGTGAALILAALFAVNPYSLIFVTRTLSETPYLMLTGLCFLAYDWWREKGSPPFLWSWVLLAALSYLTRTLGLSLLAALVAAALLNKAFRQRRCGPLPAWLAASILIAAVVASWSLYVLISGGPQQNYFGELIAAKGGMSAAGVKDIFARVAGNLLYYARQMPTEMLSAGGLSGALITALSVPFWILFGLGIYRSAKFGETAEVLYCVFYIAIVLVWPAHLDYRFLFPLMPLAYLFLWRAFEGLYRAGGKKAYVPPVAAALIVAAHLVAVIPLLRSMSAPRPYPPYTPVTMFGRVIERPVIDWSHTMFAYRTPKNIFSLGEFILMCEIGKAELPQGSVIAASKPRDVTFITGYRSVSFPPCRDAGSFIAYLSSWDVDYVFLDRMTPYSAACLPLVTASPQSFQIVLGERGRPAPAIYRYLD